MGRSENTGLTGDKKGRKGERTLSGARKVAKVSPPDSVVIISQITPTDITADLSRCATRITHGVAGETFVESGRLDWRSFGRKTYQDWVDNGWVGMVQEKIKKYHMASSAVRAQRVLVFQSELPLSFRGDRALSERVHAVQQLLAELQGMFMAGESMNQ
ncbi:hypothetical protein B484DRAFT_461677, partial [Ochromonadaceae sp. CCMP2298]